MKRFAQGEADAAAVLDAPPRRALLVAAASPALAALAAALASRGFSVETAPDGEHALRRLAEELDGFDLLVASVGGGRDDVDVLVRTVRKAGETQLAIVVVASAAQPATGLERAGADAVLDRSLGAELIVRASEAVLSRKRVRDS